MKKSNQIENVQIEAKTDLGRKIAKYFCIALFSIIALFMGFAAVANALSGYDPVLTNLEAAYKDSSSTMAQTSTQLVTAQIAADNAKSSFCDTWRALSAYKLMKKIQPPADKPATCENF